MRIRQRLLLMGLPGFVLPLAGLAATSLWLQRTADETAALRLATIQASALAESVHSALRHAESELERMVLHEAALARLPADVDPSAAEVETLLAALARQWPGFEALRIVPLPPTTGQRVPGPRTRPEWMSSLDLAHALQLLPTGILEPTAPGPVLARRLGPAGPWLLAAIPISIPLPDQPPGAEAPDPPSLERPLRWVLDSERRVLATSHPEHVPWLIEPAQLEALNASRQSARTVDLQVGGLALTGLAQPLPAGMHVVVLFPRSELFHSTRWLLLSLGCALASGLLLLWLCHGLLAHRFLVRPLERLTAAANAFVRGAAGQALPVVQSDDEIGALAKALEDIRRHLRESSLEAHRLINADALTGLPNRRYITQRLAAEISRHARRAEGCFALMFIDLDNFKAINDSMGHKAGDRLVIKVAQRLVQAIRAYDSVVPPGLDPPSGGGSDGISLVARLGGDEFLLILNDLKQPEDAARIARRLYQTFEEPIAIDTLQIHVSMSIGIVLHPGSGETAEQLIKNADVAMYAAKGAGKNQFRFYEASMEQSARRTLEIESALRGALSGRGLQLAYQPLVSLTDRSLCGAEVLLRWQHAELGSITPAEFVPVAESCGLIHELGNWVMIEAMTQLAHWKQEGLAIGKLSINLSTHQVQAEGLADRVLSLLERLGVAPRQIEFELTETAVFRHRDVAVRNLTALREAGVRFALDDFGTGYSSLSWVQHFTVDAVKIDRGFVQSIGTHTRNQAVVASVVELCQRLSLDIVAEGVETAEQATALTSLGCTHAQGYHFSRPLTAEAFTAFVHGIGAKGLGAGPEALRSTG